MLRTTIPADSPTPRETAAAPRRAHRRGLRTAVVGAGAATALVIAATPAFAHVHVTPDTLPQGSSAELAFTVPNEETSANVTEIQLQIPTDHPIAQVLARPVGQWAPTVTTTKLATPLVTDDGTFTQTVSVVTWKGGTIAPNQYEDFDINVDPLPKDTNQLVFKVIETYSDGTVTRWIDPPAAPGQPDPEHPAAVLALTPGGGDDGGAPAAAASGAPTAAATGSGGTQAASTTAKDNTARYIGYGGIAAGVIGIIVGIAGLARGRRRDVA